MGTRNLTFVQADGQYKVAQYGQWDGYPSGLGVMLLGILRTCDLVKLKEAVLKLEPISREDLEKLEKECGDRIKMRHPEYSRDTRGDGLLQMILAGKEFRPYLDSAFVGDSLMCEWAYVIDLDENTFEVYRGFNKRPLPKTARFYDYTLNGSRFYPCSLVASYKLDSLPAVVEEAAFVAYCEREDGPLDDLVELVKEVSETCP